MLELVSVDDNPEPRLISGSLDTITMCAENMRLMVFIMAAMESKDITARDWNTLLDCVTTLCGAVENLANTHGRDYESADY